jgi:hypothetical protein
MDIIKEQIVQVSQSYANTALLQRRNGGSNTASAGLTIYYNVIGGQLDPQWMSNYCQDIAMVAGGGAGSSGMTCHLMQHYESGHEMLTLDRVYEFCTMHPTMSVIYIHTKGSFHYQGSGPGFHGQDYWRRHMTTASLSRACLTHLHEESGNDNNSNNATTSACNACGMLFQPFPAQHFAGNSWAAKCR